MKKRLIAGVVLLLAIVCLCAVADAAEDPLKISMTLSKKTFTEPTTITVGIKIANAGEGDMPGPVTLWYPNGKQVEDFGSPTLTVGGSKSWSGKWTVTQSQLEAGKITFSVKYSLYNENGELVNKTKHFSLAITYEGAVTSVEIDRTITPTTAEKGQQVTVVYEIRNTGTTTVTDVKVRENNDISTAAKTVDSVAPGEKASVTFTTTMGTKNLTSKGTVTYKAGKKTETVKKDAETIKFGQVNLKATLEADQKGAMTGGSVTLKLTLKNSGKVDYNEVTVSERTLGEIFSGQTVAAGKTVTLEKEVTVDETRDYIMEVKGVDTDGLQISTSTGIVKITAMAASDVVNLSAEASADRDTVYTLPGAVRFTIAVTNNGENAVKDVAVSAAGTKLYTFPQIEPGETRSFTRDVHVSMAGTYQFEASCQDALSQTQTFASNTMYISYAQPTTVPTEAPIVTPPAPVYQDLPTDDGLPEYLDTTEQSLNIAQWVFGAAAALCLLLAVIGLIGRVRVKARLARDEIKDQVERSEAYDYTAAAKGERRIIDSGEERSDAPDEDAAADGDVMEETLNRIYAGKTAEEKASEEKETEEKPAEAESERTRRRRRDDKA